MNVPELRFSEFDSEWDDRKLSEIADVYDGTHQTPDYVKSGVPFISVENIADLKSTKKYISEVDFAKDFKIKPRMGDIMMTRITAGVIGATAIVQDHEPLAYYVSLALIRGQEKQNSNFLAQRIESPYFKRELHKRIIHVAFPKKINLGDLGDCRAVVPHLYEQKKIAAFLGVVDAKIAALRDRRAGLERYKRGLMQALFSQRLRFTRPDGTAFPDWEEKRLGEVVQVISGLTYSPENIRDTGLLVLRSSNVKNAAIVLKDRVFVDVEVEHNKLTRTDDILLCVRNGSQRLIGKSALVPDNMPKATHGAFMSILRGGKNAFVFQLMQTDLFFKEVHKNLGATINSINGSDLKKFKFWVPNHPDEQQKIADALSAMDAKIQAVADQVARMEVFKKGLLQQMFV